MCVRTSRRFSAEAVSSAPATIFSSRPSPYPHPTLRSRSSLLTFRITRARWEEILRFSASSSRRERGFRKCSTLPGFSEERRFRKYVCACAREQANCAARENQLLEKARCENLADSTLNPLSADWPSATLGFYVPI